MKPWIRLTALPLLLISLLHPAALAEATQSAAAPLTLLAAAAEKRRYVTVGGSAIGIKLYTAGVLVIGTDAVETTGGTVTPAASAGLKQGDRITAVNGALLQDAQQLTEAVEASNGKPLELKVTRGDATLNLSLLAARAADGAYRAGLWVRDSAAGIGTLTFCDAETGIFAGLGHGVCDMDTGALMPLGGGEAVLAAVSGYYRSVAGNPGELCGTFTAQVLGRLLLNGETGVYGALAAADAGQTLPVARPAEAHTGKAQMITTVDETGPQRYEVEITRISGADDRTRNLIVRITDSSLLEKTGGILQGMSGSPIIQDSMLIGAVTHVFVNDPAQGYGIFAQTMLQTADALAARSQKDAA